MVTPNQVIFNGDKRPEETQDGDLIKLDEVKFAYPSKPEVPILRGISIDVRKGQVVALVGQSGCGKSSIISLVERFYDPLEGKVLYSGEDLKDLDNTWYHQQNIALVQ